MLCKYLPYFNILTSAQVKGSVEQSDRDQAKRPHGNSLPSLLHKLSRFDAGVGHELDEVGSDGKVAYVEWDACAIVRVDAHHLLAEEIGNGDGLAKRRKLCYANEACRSGG
jgi:hypothetical protein